LRKFKFLLVYFIVNSFPFIVIFSPLVSWEKIFYSISFLILLQSQNWDSIKLFYHLSSTLIQFLFLMYSIDFAFAFDPYLNFIWFFCIIFLIRSTFVLFVIPLSPLCLSPFYRVSLFCVCLSCYCTIFPSLFNFLFNFIFDSSFLFEIPCFPNFPQFLRFPIPIPIRLQFPTNTTVTRGRGWDE